MTPSAPNPITRLSLALAIVLTIGMARDVAAHEFYLQPQTFRPTIGEPVTVGHFIGTEFKGNEQPYVGRWNVRSEMWVDGRKFDVPALDGDRPALTITPQKDDLIVLAHQSNIDTLDFRSWEKFATYAEKEGLSAVAERHLSAGRPKPTTDQPLRELYARYAKTLLAPGGSTKGRDVPVGLTIELVAQDHPLALSAGEPLNVQLLWQGKPLPGALVKVFPAVGEEHKHRLVTDENGMVAVPDDGPGPYLLNAINMIEPVATGEIAKDADYQSFWASLTFAR